MFLEILDQPSKCDYIIHSLVIAMLIIIYNCKAETCSAICFCLTAKLKCKKLGTVWSQRTHYAHYLCVAVFGSHATLHALARQWLRWADNPEQKSPGEEVFRNMQELSRLRAVTLHPLKNKIWMTFQQVPCVYKQ